MRILNIIYSSLSWRVRYLRRFLLSRLSLLFATCAGLPGIKFGWFGLWCSRKCRRQGEYELASVLSNTPVNCVRYFEFDFVDEMIPDGDDIKSLDIGSPRLFSAKLLNARADVQLVYSNPDIGDLNETKKFFASICAPTIPVVFDSNYAENLGYPINSFDCIWSISVIEHISQPQDELALRNLWSLLKPGGCLILTVPVCRSGYNEFRESNVYGLDKNESKTEEGYFFQRWYDQVTIKERILRFLPDARIIKQTIWGEKIPGWFSNYAKRWVQDGATLTCKDPYYMATKFTEFNNVSDLPGCGLAGFAIVKDLNKTSTLSDK